MEKLMRIDVDVESVSTSDSIPDQASFERWVSSALEGRQGSYSLAIRIIDEEEMQHFNAGYRQKNYPTNVLSFPAELPSGLPEELRDSTLGDLLICAPVVKREAHEQHRSETDHWAHLTVHGVLHLLGHDHEEPAEAMEMESLEIAILAKLGISDPYSDIS